MSVQRQIRDNNLLVAQGVHPIVFVVDHVARGLSNYSSEDVTRIMGLKSSKIAQVLGMCPYQEVIHRDNLAVVE